MKRSRLGPGKKSLTRGSTFAAPRQRLARSVSEDAATRTGRPLHNPPPALSDRLIARESVRRANDRKMREARRDRRFRAWVRRTAREPCAMCGSHMAVTGHHVIPLAALKVNGIAPHLWFDPRNHLPLCMEPSESRCHQRHELYVRRVPRLVVLALAPQALEFAEEVELVHVFDRHYPVEPNPTEESP